MTAKEAFFTTQTSFDTRVRFDDDLNKFIVVKVTDDPKLADLWNLKYNNFCKGFNLAKKEFEEIETIFSKTDEEIVKSPNILTNEPLKKLLSDYIYIFIRRTLK